MSDYAVYEGKLVPVDELMHHGIKGMKWGVRRYQNPDGSLTEVGRKRYYGYGTLDTEGRAAYKSYKKINGELVGQATRRASVVGGLAGGAIGLATGGPAGAFAGLMGSMVLSTVATATINTGAAWVSNKKYKKALIKQADEKRHAQEIRDNAQKKDNEFYKKVINSEEKRAGRQLTDKEKADAIKSYSKEGRGEEAAKKYLEQEKSSKEVSSGESNKKASKDSTIERWDNIPKNVSFNDYCKKYLRTDPIKTREADEELYSLLKMEYDEFKRYKNN